MKTLVGMIAALFLTAAVHADVRIFIADSNGVAWVRYQCTSGEIVRAFALNVTVDRGQIVGVSDFFRGPGTSAATGYGIFPASFRDRFGADSGTNIDWNDVAYTPLANPADNPVGTLPGLGSGGVTLELGALWDPVAPDAVPPPRGTLCALQLSQPAIVSVTTNALRGGVIGTVPGVTLNPLFTGAPVGPSILTVTPQNGTVVILFNGGELQVSSSLQGPWTGTGDFSGSHTESFDPNQPRFYRVRAN